MKDIKRDNSGFSLVELLIAMVIIAIVLTPLYSNFSRNAIEERIKEIMGGSQCIYAGGNHIGILQLRLRVGK